jgi:LysM repeat protein
VVRIRLVSRRAIFRVVAPAAFLLAATIAVLLIRAGLHHRADKAKPPATLPVRTAPATRPSHPARKTGKRSYYAIRSGDTLDIVALKFNTTVGRLLRLNPGIDPHALRIGEKIRIR